MRVQACTVAPVFASHGLPHDFSFDSGFTRTPETPTKEAEKETSLVAGAALLLAVLLEVCFLLAFCQEEAKTAEPVEPA